MIPGEFIGSMEKQEKDSGIKIKKIKPFQETILLRGTIENLKRSKRSHDFLLTQGQQAAIGATAIGATALGVGSGIGLVNMAMNSDEEADWVEFELDGKQVQGWIWVMPMRNGDVVEVVAERATDQLYVAYAVKRDTDQIVAIYPHATSGRKIHYWRIFKVMLWTFFLINLIFFISLYWGWSISKIIDDIDFVVLVMSGSFVMFGFLFYRGARKMMNFVYIAEAIFRTYGWPDVESIDLYTTSQKSRQENENTCVGYGTRCFRYK